MSCSRSRCAPRWTCGERYADKGGFNAVVIKLRLPDGRMYGQTGKLDFMDNTISASTDTLILRGSIPNPLLSDGKVGNATIRELVDGEFVSVVLEGVQPVRLLTVPRAAVLSDQRGDYVYVVDAQNKVEQTRIQIGQSTPTVASVLSGLTEGALVITDGVQKVHPGQVVSPGPASPPVTASPAGTARRRPPATSAPRRRTRRCLDEQKRQRPMISSVFIDRPRLAIVIAIVITIAGALAMLRIPVAQLPDIVPPQVTVTANYPGASANVVESAVAQPIEAQVVGVDKMIYMKSNSGNDGSYSLTVSFDLSSNPDIDVVNVNNRVQTALSQLPPEVQLEGLTVQKRSTSILEFLALYSDDPKMDPLFISNYVLINVLDQLSRTPGVGQANLFSKLNYSMRVWFDTDRLTALSLTPGDIIAAIQSQNVVAPIGRVGARPIGNDQQFQFNLQTQGRLVTPAEFGAIVIRANQDGSVLRLRDVARIELGAQNMDSETRLNGRPGVPIGIYLSPGANAVDTAAAVAQTLATLEKRFPPGLHAQIMYDSTAFVRDTRTEVLRTLGHRLRPGGGRRVPVPRQRARHHHSDRGRPGQPDRHLRRLARARLHREHRVVARHGAGGGRRGR